MKNDAELKLLLRNLVETYNRHNEYASIYEPLKYETEKEIDSLVSYIKLNY